MSYIIRGLEGGQHYEAKVLAKNRYGWSPMSEPFTFQTTETGMKLSNYNKFLFSKNIVLILTNI